jgi:hypothetical protein
VSSATSIALASSGTTIIYSVAGPWGETLAQAMARRGILFVYGYLSNQATPFPTGPAITKGLWLRGYLLMEVTQDPQRLARAVDFITRGLDTGVDPVVAGEPVADDEGAVHSHDRYSTRRLTWLTPMPTRWLSRRAVRCIESVGLPLAFSSPDRTSRLLGRNIG